jgi:hypothetical protein
MKEREGDGGRGSDPALWPESMVARPPTSRDYAHRAPLAPVHMRCTKRRKDTTLVAPLAVLPWPQPPRRLAGRGSDGGGELESRKGGGGRGERRGRE